MQENIFGERDFYGHRLYPLTAKQAYNFSKVNEISCDEILSLIYDLIEKAAKSSSYKQIISMNHHNLSAGTKLKVIHVLEKNGFKVENIGVNEYIVSWDISEKMEKEENK